MISKKLKTKWLKALRSGEYKQTTDCLHDKNGHCCLGVLKEVATGKALIPNKRYKLPAGMDADCKLIPYCGLTSDMLSKLADMNDSGFNFPSIARYISRNIKAR